MIINESGLIAAMKRAYKADGYTVLNSGGAMAIYTENWFVLTTRALLPRKGAGNHRGAHGHDPGGRYAHVDRRKDEEPQMVLRETAADDMEHWRGGDRGEEVTVVPVIMQGFRSTSRPAAEPAGAFPCI